MVTKNNTKTKKEPVSKIEDYGLTKKQIVLLYSREFWYEFRDWMYGQTYAIIEGKGVYYYYDISRFARMYESSLGKVLR